MRNRLRNLTTVTPDTARAARLVALVALGLAAFVAPLRIFMFVALIAGGAPGVAIGAVRLLGVPIALAVTGAAIWLWVAGSYAPVRDILLLAALTIAALRVSTDWRRWWAAGCVGASPRFDLRMNYRAGLLVFMSFWGASSGLDVFLRPVPPTPGSASRFETLRAQPSRFSGKTAAVALSGGGYRAALVHAGVLYALEDLGVQVTAISSVSGGSIIGSYYATGSSPLDFLQIMQQRTYGLARELTRAPAGARSLIGLLVANTRLEDVAWLRYERTDAQATLLDHVFLHGVRLRDLGDDVRPRLMLGTTDTLTGRTLGFTPHGVYAHDAQTLFLRTSLDGDALVSDRQSTWIPPFSTAVWDQPVARFVAASGAFPGALTPVRETLVLGRNIRGEILEEPVRLADGGLTDNSGLALLLVALTDRQPPDFIDGREAWRQWTADVVIASDGGQFLEGTEGSAGWLDDVSRAADIVYANAGLRFVPDASHPPPPLTLLAPAEPAFRGRQWVRDGNPMGCEMLMRGPRREGQTIDEELKAAIDAFGRTPTLADRIEPEDARLLFRMGQFLVARNWSGIWADLGEPDAATAHIGPNWREVQAKSACNRLP